MVKAQYVWLRCSRCQRRFRGSTRAEALGKLRKHLWKEHRAWMVSRIKSGLRKAKKTKADNPALTSALKSIISPSWVGFAEKPVIEKITGLDYDVVKGKVLDFFVNMLMSGILKQ
jgi:hypothetical protein